MCVCVRASLDAIASHHMRACVLAHTAGSTVATRVCCELWVLRGWVSEGLAMRFRCTEHQDLGRRHRDGGGGGEFGGVQRVHRPMVRLHRPAPDSAHVFVGLRIAVYHANERLCDATSHPDVGRDWHLVPNVQAGGVHPDSHVGCYG